MTMHPQMLRALPRAYAGGICTDGRTDGLTKNLQDQGDHLTLRNAHEKHPESIILITGRRSAPSQIGDTP